MDQGSSIETRVSALVGVFSASDADPAWLLCDRHPTESIAFTLVEADGSRTDLTYGELALHL
jgi:acetyl-CoA synthetase